MYHKNAEHSNKSLPPNFTIWWKNGTQRTIQSCSARVQGVFSWKKSDTFQTGFDTKPSGEAKIAAMFGKSQTKEWGFHNWSSPTKWTFSTDIKAKTEKPIIPSLSHIPETSYNMIRKTETTVAYQVSAYDPITLREVEKIPRWTKITMKRGDSIRTITGSSGKKEAYLYVIAKDDIRNPYAPYQDSCRLLVRAPWLDGVVNQKLSAESITKAVIAYAQLKAREIENERQLLIAEQKKWKNINEIKQSRIFQRYTTKVQANQESLPLIRAIREKWYDIKNLTKTGEFKKFIEKAKRDPELGWTIQKIANGITNTNI